MFLSQRHEVDPVTMLSPLQTVLEFKRIEKIFAYSQLPKAQDVELYMFITHMYEFKLNVLVIYIMSTKNKWSLHKLV